MIEGVKGKTFLINDRNDKEEVARVVEEATSDVLRRPNWSGLCRGKESKATTEIIRTKKSYSSYLSPAVEHKKHNHKTMTHSSIFLCD